MKILYLTPKPIFPVIDGGCFAMKNFLEVLSATEHEIDVIEFQTPKHQGDQALFKKHFPSLNLTQYFVNTKIQFFPFIINTLFKKNTSYNVHRFFDLEHNASLKKRLKQQHYDLIILESIFLASYLPLFEGKIPFAVRSHNVEFQLWDQYATFEKNGVKKIILKKLAKDLKKVELSTIEKAKINFVLSKEDKQTFESFSNTPQIYLPIHLQVNKRTKPVNPKSICHLGSMNWQPNIDAVHYLIHVLFPELLLSVPDAKLHLAGSHSQKQNLRPEISQHGFVVDYISFYQDHGILVSPISISSGVRIKILEALANGIPVLTTTEGAKGIDLEDQMMVENELQQQVNQLKRMMGHPEVLEQFIQKGYDYIEKNHSKSHVYSILNKTLNG